MKFEHYTVMKEETVNLVLNKNDGIYIDGTFGGGGHSYYLNDITNNQAHIIGFDQDYVAYQFFQKNNKNNKIKLINDNIVNIKEQLKSININKIDGLILDLGFSSVQVDTADRGFSYMQDGPLDMRMNQKSDITAKYIINNYEQKKIERILKIYGEEKFANRIARNICEKRSEKEIDSTLELVDIIEEAIPIKFKYKSKGHCAKKTFQALRIEVNQELEILEKIVKDAFELLNVGGKISIITFHSLEDKIIKNLFKELSSVDSEIKELPVIPDEYMPKAKIINKKPILPSDEEIKINSRSKSAKLRGLEKIKDV